MTILKKANPETEKSENDIRKRNPLNKYNSEKGQFRKGHFRKKGNSEKEEAGKC